MSLKYEPSSEPLQICVKKVFLDRKPQVPGVVANFMYQHILEAIKNKQTAKIPEP